MDLSVCISLYELGMCIPNLPVDLQMVIMLNNYRLEATSPINCVM